MSDRSQERLRKAYDAMRHNRFESARSILARLVRSEPDNEQAWLALAKVVEEKDQTIYCLRQVVRLNPDNRSARKWLESLKLEKVTGAHRRPLTPHLSPPELQKERTRQPGQAPPAGTTGLNLEEAESREHLPHRRRNWPLILGSILFLTIVFLAIAGPSLAPRDPLEENLIIQVDDGWEIPPFELLTPGFPLGSDEFGRDLLSRLLWGIQPTMVMVLIVAAVRLLMGTIIGLIAGWSNGRFGRGLDTIIEGALSIPVLLVALGAIAIVGVELGIWAFIIGLSLTGWVESAQQVREQTRITKGQVFIEAAHALGASNRQILFNHVLKQITPMTVMLIAFELSSTLMTTAGLGFLGYYIGGDVWVDVDDFVARRISGTPELGQMLATSWAKLTEPWAMVAVGTTIFLAVLSFNLLGEGFRNSLNLTVSRRSVVSRLNAKVSFWLDQNVWYPLSIYLQKPVVRGAMAGVLVALITFAAGRSLWPEIQARLVAQEPPASKIAAVQPGESGQHSSPEIDDGTPDQSIPTPQQEKIEPEIAWQFEEESGFHGGPTLAPQGEQFYIASAGGELLAIDLAGEVQWQTEIPAGGVGNPAVGVNGQIYISDNQAGLAAISAEGRVLWYFQSEAGNRSVAGPVLASDGRIFYTVTTGSKGFIQAVSAEGQGMWVTQANTPSFFEAPRLSADENFVFLKNDVFDAQSGELLTLESDLNVLRYFPGGDGHDYLLAGQNVIQWQPAGATIEVLDIAEWDSSGLSQVAAPQEVGVRPDKTAWLLYTSPGGTTRLVWVTLDDQLIGSTGYAVSRGQVVDMRQDLTTYVCGGRSFDEQFVECAALDPEAHDEIWGLKLGNQGPVQGGFWKDGRLYIATRSGTIFAIDEQPASVQALESSGTSRAAQAGQAGIPGLLWTHDLGENVNLNARNGLFYRHDPNRSEVINVYIFSDDDRVFAINPQGQRLYEARLPVGFLQPEPGRDGYFPPFIMQDGTIIIVGQENLIYALNPKGDVAWEHSLDAGPYRWSRAADEVFITDSQAGLYVFDSQGLKWKFRSDAGQRSASGAVKAPDGRVYYTVTPSSKGVVQAVSPDGKGLWATEVKTGSFYHTPQVSSAGDKVFLRDDVIDAETGQLLVMNTPLQVDEYVIGEDGKLYLRSGHTVIEWQYGQDGFEIVNTISWNHSQFSGQPFSTWVSAGGLVGMSYRGAQVWVNPDGEVIAVIRYPSSGRTLQKVDIDARLVTECDRQVSRILRCSAFEFGSSQAVWEVEVEDVPKFDFWNSIWTDEHLYVLAEDKLHKYFIGNPATGE